MLFENCRCLVGSPANNQGFTEVVVGDGIPRVDIYRLLKMDDGFVDLSAICKGDSKIVVRLHIFGVAVMAFR